MHSIHGVNRFYQRK